jgi:hypothetical protein
MSRRPSLPGAAELFRVTGGPATASAPAAAPQPAPERDNPATPIRESARPEASGSAAPPIAIRPVPQSEQPYERPSDDEQQDFAAPPRRQSGGSRRRMRAVGERRPTGRERHEEKITVYCSAEELVDLEHARLQLRADHGIAIDRGRIVREAVAVVLADLEAKGESSILVRRLRES